MPNLSAQQLADIVLPLFEREPKLRPIGLEYHGGKRRQRDDDGCSYVSAWQWTLHDEAIIGNEGLESATQLCESSMVRKLMLEGVGPAEYLTDYGCKVTIGLGDDIVDFTAPTLIQALAAACTAVLDAKERKPTV